MTIELTESIQLTTHFEMNISDFFASNTSVTNFINNLCALLNIVDTSRVKVVGVHSGSTAVTAVVGTSTSTTVTAANGTVVNNTDPPLSTIASTLTTMISTGTFTTTMSTVGFGNVLKTTSVYFPISTS